MKIRLVNILKYALTVLLASILLTVMVDALESPDGVSLKFWQKSDTSLCPSDMVAVISPTGDYCIDKYEASPGPGCDISELNSQNETNRNLDNKDCAPVSVPGENPWNYVTKGQAQALCARAGKRLPSATEWYYAALGTPDLDDGWTESDCQVNHNWSMQPGLTGSGSECSSGAGAQDMIGNVWEWVNDVAINGMINGKALPEPGYVYSLDSDGTPLETGREEASEMENDYLWLKKSGPKQIARGGYYDNQEQAGVNAWYIVNDSVFSGVGVGFRCVR
jgi:formylglycine-generating enzyme required for sulfatase activity